jgi:hypothetical protein
LIVAVTILSVTLILSTIGIKVYHEAPRTGEYPKETKGTQEIVRKEERREEIIVKRGIFLIQDASCIAGNPGSIKIVASYSGDSTTPLDVVVEIRNKLTGVETPYYPPIIYKGTACNIYTIGTTNCNIQVAVTNPVTSGETVGFQIFAGSIASGTGIDITIRVFGQSSGTYSVTCY